MGLSLRLLLLDQTDRIYRLGITRFDRMRASPGMYPLPQFAGQRVRSAEVAVELVERRPSRVLRAAFATLAFDQAGCLDAEAFSRQQFARSVDATVPQGALGDRAREQPNIRDACFLFDDRGGRWVPTKSQLQSIHDAALGKKPISRL
jgi:hypothetical protein